jgi:hypothetical protein
MLIVAVRRSGRRHCPGANGRGVAAVPPPSSAEAGRIVIVFGIWFVVLGVFADESAGVFPV